MTSKAKKSKARAQRRKVGKQLEKELEKPLPVPPPKESFSHSVSKPSIQISSYPPSTSLSDFKVDSLTQSIIDSRLHYSRGFSELRSYYRPLTDLEKEEHFREHGSSF